MNVIIRKIKGDYCFGSEVLLNLIEQNYTSVLFLFLNIYGDIYLRIQGSVWITQIAGERKQGRNSTEIAEEKIIQKLMYLYIFIQEK